MKLYVYIYMSIDLAKSTSSQWQEAGWLARWLARYGCALAPQAATSATAWLRVAATSALHHMHHHIRFLRRFSILRCSLFLSPMVAVFELRVPRDCPRPSVLLPARRRLPCSTSLTDSTHWLHSLTSLTEAPNNVQKHPIADTKPQPL